MDHSHESSTSPIAAPSPHAEVLYPDSVFTPQILSVTAFLAASILVIVSVLLARGKAAKRGDAVVLVGHSDAGKTAILSMLAYNQNLTTHASMQTNVVLLALPSSTKTLRLVDVPGHPRIRGQFKEFLPQAKAVVFVVDASTVSRNGSAVAEHLHQVLHALNSLPPSQSQPALLIAAHKCDLLKATAHASREELAVTRVRTILERELEKRRAAQIGGVGVESLGEEGAEGELGGLDCGGSGEFKFAQWEGGEVGFVGTALGAGKSAAAEENEKAASGDGLESLRRWLQDLV